MANTQKRKNLFFSMEKLKLSLFCVCISYKWLSLSLSLSMQMCANNELMKVPQAQEPWPPHHSARWSPLKSDIVSLRFHSQSSAGLSIVGGTESELRLIYGGRRRAAHIISGPAAEQSSSGQQVLNASFQTWVRNLQLPESTFSSF